MEIWWKSDWIRLECGTWNLNLEWTIIHIEQVFSKPHEATIILYQGCYYVKKCRWLIFRTEWKRHLKPADQNWKSLVYQLISKSRTYTNGINILIFVNLNFCCLLPAKLPSKKKFKNSFCGWSVSCKNITNLVCPCRKPPKMVHAIVLLLLYCS